MLRNNDAKNGRSRVTGNKKWPITGHVTPSLWASWNHWSVTAHQTAERQ